jgi:uncharacterized protein (DUF58 family)
VNTQDLLKKIQVIEIKTRGLTKHIFSGEYHSAFKGRGMAFSEVRDYQAGDEVRTIDWNVTARFNSPFVKVFEEERELTVMLLIDVSGSQEFGSNEKTKKELLLELAAVLAFSAVENNDKIGALFFSDRVEKYIAPRKGKKHALLLLREMIECKPTSKATNLNEALRYFRNVMKKRSIAFVLSDFVDAHAFDEGLKISRKKHDMVALHVVDNAEFELPNVGLIQLFNAETGRSTWVDSADKAVREAFRNQALVEQDSIKNRIKKVGIDYAEFNTHEDYIPKLVKLFQSR